MLAVEDPDIDRPATTANVNPHAPPALLHAPTTPRQRVMSQQAQRASASVARGVSKSWTFVTAPLPPSSASGGRPLRLTPATARACDGAGFSSVRGMPAIDVAVQPNFDWDAERRVSAATPRRPPSSAAQAQQSAARLPSVEQRHRRQLTSAGGTTSGVPHRPRQQLRGLTPASLSSTMAVTQRPDASEGVYCALDDPRPAAAPAAALDPLAALVSALEQQQQPQQLNTNSSFASTWSGVAPTAAATDASLDASGVLSGSLTASMSLVGGALLDATNTSFGMMGSASFSGAFTNPAAVAAASGTMTTRLSRREMRERRATAMQSRFAERRGRFVRGVCNGVAVCSAAIGGAWPSPAPLQEAPEDKEDLLLSTTREAERAREQVRATSASMAGVPIEKTTAEQRRKEEQLRSVWRSVEEHAGQFDHVPVPALRHPVPFAPSSPPGSKKKTGSSTTDLQYEEVRSPTKAPEQAPEQQINRGDDAFAASTASPFREVSDAATASVNPSASMRAVKVTFTADPLLPPPAPAAAQNAGKKPTAHPPPLSMSMIAGRSRNNSAAGPSASAADSAAASLVITPASSVMSAASASTSSSPASGSGWKRLRSLSTMGVLSKVNVQSPTRPTRDRTNIGRPEVSEYERQMEIAEQRVHGETAAELARRKLAPYVKRFSAILDDIKVTCGFDESPEAGAQLDAVGEALRMRHISLLYGSLHPDGAEKYSPLTEMDASTADPDLLRSLKQREAMQDAERHWRTKLGGTFAGTAHVSSKTTPWSAVPALVKARPPQQQQQQQEQEEQQAQAPRPVSNERRGSRAERTDSSRDGSVRVGSANSDDGGGGKPKTRSRSFVDCVSSSSSSSDDDGNDEDSKPVDREDDGSPADGGDNENNADNADDLCGRSTVSSASLDSEEREMEEQIQLRVSESMAQLQQVRSTPFVHGAEDGLDNAEDDDDDGAALQRQGTSVPYSPGVERAGGADHAPAAAAHSDHDGDEPVPFDDLDLGSPATARARATALGMSRPRPLLLTPEALVAKQVQCGVDMEESEVMVQLARMHLKALGEPPASTKNTRVARVLM